MHLGDENPTYYDVLELTSAASPQEIRSAYLRLKAAYSKDSIALYSLIDKEEMSNMADRIEEAYLILSHPEKRRAYDIAQGLISPMEEDPFKTIPDPTPILKPTISEKPVFVEQPNSALASNFSSTSAKTVLNDSEIELEIQNASEWTGALVRKVRESRRISLEDLSDFTRISRIYLKSIEDEDFSKLPAAVYLRGFLIQLAKRLKIPQEPFVTQYLQRFKNARPDKA